MKTIYYSNKVRIRIINNSGISGKYIALRIQEKGWLFWSTVEELDIELKNYWGYIPGDIHFGGCLRMGYAYGGYLEVWPPDIFDLKKRTTEFMKEYFEKNRARIMQVNAIKKQMENL